jgi:hypothetical protein
MREQHHDEADPEQRIVRELIDEHVHVSCNVVVIDDHTWAIHGLIAVDGDVILAEFDDPAAAESVLGQHSAIEQRLQDASDTRRTS